MSGFVSQRFEKPVKSTFGELTGSKLLRETQSNLAWV